MEIADEALRGRGRRHVLRFTPIKLTRVNVRETLGEEQRGRKREDAVGSIGAWRGSSLTVRNFWRGANVSWERAKRQWRTNIPRVPRVGRKGFTLLG